MTDPANPWQADNQPAVEPWAAPPGEWQDAGVGPGPGYVPQGQGGPGYWPPGYGWPAPPPRRPWYRAPGSLTGAAVFSALSAWVTLAGIGIGASFLNAMDAADGGEGLMMLILAIGLLPVIALVVLTGFCMTVAGAAATVPLAVIWSRTPDRSTSAGIFLLLAVLSWAALAIGLVWAF